MPTFTSTPQQGFTKPSGPPRKPKPGENIHPDSRLAQQKPDVDPQRKDPFLQAHGFNGTVDSFNRRVDKAYNGYTNAYGKEPSPGLIWDVVRNPKVMDDQIPDLFKIPLDGAQVKGEQAHLESQWNGEGYHVREDGQAQKTNGITAYHQTEEFHHQELQNPPHVMPVKQFQKKYPAIEMGMFPQLPFSGTFWKDVYTSQGHEQTIKETIGNLSPKQMSQLVAGAGTAGNRLTANQAGIADQQQQFAQQQAAAAAQAEIDPAKKKAVYDSTLQKFLGPTLGRDAVDAFNKAHQRNTQRQEWLIDHDPSNLFAGLKPTGVFDKNWMVALDKWSRTPGAANSYLQSLATQNEFATTPQGIHQMEEALKLKQQYVNSKQALPDKWIAQGMPLKFFSGHQYQFSILDNAKYVASGQEIRVAETLDHAMKDFWSYETTGLNWKIFPVALLQAGFRGFKLGYNTIGGVWNQGIADTTGLTTMFGQMADGKSLPQVAHDVHQAFEDNPDLVRTLGFGFIPQHLTGTPAVLDQIGNFILQTAAALLIDGPGYTKLGEGDSLATWKKNPYLWLANKIAHTQIKVGDLASAEAIFGGEASDAFIRATERGVRNGDISPQEFHGLATEFARNGKVELPDGKVLEAGQGNYIHGRMTDKNLPKHVTGLRLKQAKLAMERAATRAERHALANGSLGAKAGETFARAFRGITNQLELASPEGKTIAAYKLNVGNLKSFILSNDLMPADEAQQTINRFIRARGAERTTRMHDILDRVIKSYKEKYPLKTGSEAQHFESLLETEGQVNVKFPSSTGRVRRGENPVSATLDSFVDFSNNVGRMWRQAILGTGPGLFYKHATRDPIAAALGLFDAKWIKNRLVHPREYKSAVSQFEAMMNEDQSALREFSTARHTVKGSDTIYSTSFRDSRSTGGWNLMQKIDEEPQSAKEYAHAAAEWMRNQVQSDIIPSYFQYKASGDLAPMVEEVLSNQKLKAMMYRDTGLGDALKELPKQTTEFKFEKGKHPLASGSVERQINEDALKELRKSMETKAASDYVAQVVQRLDGVEKAGKDAGVQDFLSQMWKMQRDNPGSAGTDVANFLLKNKVDVHIPNAEVVPKSRWDRFWGRLVTSYMKPNRVSRDKMFTSLSHKLYADFIKRGYEPRAAFSAATGTAKFATQFHLLDFSNMLEFERKYRGILPFFTKHRLFIKWLAGTIVHRPGLAGVIANQLSPHLDQYGRLNFTLPGVGIPVNLNLMKLMFLSSEQVPPTIPVLGFTPLGQATGLGSQITRVDPLFNLWGHILLTHPGHLTWSYDEIATHLDPYTRARLDKYMALYAINQRMRHGLGSYVSPTDALKYAAIRVSRDIPVNGLFLTPFGISSPQNPPEIQRLNDRYDKLLTTNPNAAQALLEKHPEIGLAWGKAENFNVYNHMTQMWGMYDEVQKAYAKVEDKFSQMELEGKTLTPADYQEMHKASVKYSNQIQNLRMLDANLWNHDTNNKGEPGFPAVSPEELSTKQPYGPWYTQFSHDPLGTVQKLEDLFGGPKAWSAKDLHNVYGADLVQAEVAISSAKDSTTREYWLNEIKRLQGAQKVTAKQTFYQDYHAAFSAYENKVFNYYAKAKTASGTQKALLEWKAAEAIRQEYEHPYVKFDGKEVKVLPFAEYSVLQASPQTRIKDIFKNAIGFSYGSMTLDQRLALGLPDATPALDAAWHELEYNVAAYEQQTGKTASSSYRDALAIALNKQTPGFWKAYTISKYPRSFVLYDYGHGAFAGRYGKYWKEAVTLAVTAYNKDKYGWSNYVTNTLYPFIQSRWPKGFQDELKIAGGANFLISLNTAWG